MKKLKKATPDRINRFFLLGVFIWLISTFSVKACDCLWQGDILEIQHKADYIIKAKVIGFDLYSENKSTGVLYPSVFIVEVEKVYKPYAGNIRLIGKINTIRIAGNIDSDCRPNASHFSLGSEWILALFDSDPNDFNIHFTISNCGEYYIPIDNGKASREIKQNESGNFIKEKADLEDFEEKLLEVIQRATK